MRVSATCGLWVALVTTAAGLPRPGKFEWGVNRVRNIASYMRKYIRLRARRCLRIRRTYAEPIRLDLVDFPACPENSDLPCLEDGINIARWCDRPRGAALHRAGPFSNQVSSPSIDVGGGPFRPVLYLGPYPRSLWRLKN